MPRYIDADALMKEFRDFVRESNNSDFAPVPNWNDAVSLVGSAPTADVVKRKKGKWIWMGEKVDSRFMCSVCKSKENVPTIMGKPEVWWFCPNCGAKMRKETEDEHDL